MKVFISWSGNQSQVLAEALREWFPLVLHYVEPWLSKSDIKAGDRWSIEIAKGLETCNFGVICITRENLNSPWILFEAGALAKSMQEGRVIPLLLDLDFKEVSGPLSQFQAKKADNDGIKEMVVGLNKAAPSPVPDQQLEKLCSALWNDLENKIASIPKGAISKHSRPQGEILEELVSSIRKVEMRFRDVVDDDQISRKRRRPRVHPEIVYVLMNQLADGPNDPVLLLLIAGLLRDDAPWLYELALDAYRTVKADRKEEALKALRRLDGVLEFLQRDSFLVELGLDGYAIQMLRSASSQVRISLSDLVY